MLSMTTSLLEKSRIKQIITCSQCKQFPMFTLDPNDPENVIQYCSICKTKRIAKVKDLSEEMLLREKEQHDHKCESPGHQNEKAIQYCITCDKWICYNCGIHHSQQSHQVSEKNTVSQKCIEHKQLYEKYCPHCQLNLCKLCYDNHTDNHKEFCINLSELLNSKNLLSFQNYRRSLKSHTQQIGFLYNKIIDEIENYKKAIKNAYERTKNINSNILELYDIFLELAVLFKSNYNVFHNIKDFCKFSFKKFKIDQADKLNFQELTVKDLKEFENYLTKSSLIVQNSSNDLTNMQKISSIDCNNFISCTSYYKHISETNNTEMMVIGFNDGSLKLIDINDPKKTLFNIKDENKHKHKSPILSLLIDNDYIYSGSVDQYIKKWKVIKKVKTFQLLFEGKFRGHCGDINKIIKSPEQDQIISCSSDNLVVYWNSLFQNNQTENEMHKSILLDDEVISIAYLPTTNYLLIATISNRLYLYDIYTQEQLFRLDNIVCRYPGCLKEGIDNVVIGGFNCIKVIKIEDKTLKVITSVDLNDNVYKDMDFTQDMVNIIVDENDNILFTNSKNKIYKFMYKTQSIQTREITGKKKIDGFVPIENNRYALIFGKTMEIFEN